MLFKGGFWRLWALLKGFFGIIWMVFSRLLKQITSWEKGGCMWVSVDPPDADVASQMGINIFYFDVSLF